jgi:aminoglycoside phosphotransferase (APT) family kinase protein
MTAPEDFDVEPTRSSRSRETLRTQLAGWFEASMPGSAPELGEVTSPSGSGMSSETLLFDATWTDNGERRTAPLVVRLAPAVEDVPVFPSYDLDKQFRLLHLLQERSSVPVPAPVRYEADPAHLGAPFFVMERVTGRVPADIPPYNMDGWLLTATPEEQRRLQDGAVGVLAQLHNADLRGLDLGWLETDAPGETALRRHVNYQRWFYDWVREDRTYPLIEETFEWLDAHWPAESAPVISWGDSRIGNIMFDGFDPVAVFDWEMAATGPAELDAGWMIFLHDFFEAICRQFSLAGMPTFMRRDDVKAVYETAAGRPLVDLEWYEVYAAHRHAIIMARIHARSMHFGQAEPHDNPDDAITHAAVLRQMLDGTWF